MTQTSLSAGNLVDRFFQVAADSGTYLKRDTNWPLIADEVLAGIRDKVLVFDFWNELEARFISLEQTIGQCHKGQIYWHLCIMYLARGDFQNFSDSLTKAAGEDLIIGNSHSAAIGLKSVLSRLVDPDGTIETNFNAYYQELDNSEKADIAKHIFDAHNVSAQRGINNIYDNSFGFVENNSLREILQSTYSEVRTILLSSPGLNTYYSAIFSTGSILETMLDDLFLRDDEALWRSFQASTTIQPNLTGGNLLSRTGAYPIEATLGTKVAAMCLIFRYDPTFTQVNKSLYPLMKIISQYRDLIHPRRRLGDNYTPDWYVAATLFTFISHVASNWWRQE